MLLKNSLKQMGRIKAKTFTFMLLIIFASTFLSIGINLWIGCNENLKEYEKVFKTITATAPVLWLLHIMRHNGQDGTRQPWLLP